MRLYNIVRMMRRILPSKKNESRKKLWCEIRFWRILLYCGERLYIGEQWDWRSLSNLELHTCQRTIVFSYTHIYIIILYRSPNIRFLRDCNLYKYYYYYYLLLLLSSSHSHRRPSVGYYVLRVFDKSFSILLFLIFLPTRAWCYSLRRRRFQKTKFHYDNNVQ